MKREMFSAIFTLFCVFAERGVLPCKASLESGNRVELNETVKCQKTCHQLPALSNQNETGKRISSCLKKCFDEVRTTTSNEIRPTSITQTDWCNSSKKGWGIKSEGQIFPGDAQDLNVLFIKQDCVWYAKVTWSLPKGVKVTDPWAGYVLLWSSFDRIDVSCHQPLDKSRNEFLIKSGNGWKYPEEFYVAVVGIPTTAVSVSLMVFNPVTEKIDLEPRPTRLKTAQDVKSGKWFLIGGIALGIGLLCLVAALFIRSFMKSNKKKTWESKCNPGRVTAIHGTAGKEQLLLLNSSVAAV